MIYPTGNTGNMGRSSGARSATLGPMPSGGAAALHPSPRTPSDIGWGLMSQVLFTTITAWSEEVAGLIEPVKTSVIRIPIEPMTFMVMRSQPSLFSHASVRLRRTHSSFV